MKGKITIFFTLMILIISSSLVLANEKNLKQYTLKDDKPLKITVDWVEAIDPMDVADGPEWFFTIRVYKSAQDYSQYQEIIEYADGTYDHWDVGKTYEFEVFSNDIPISIILNEDDAVFDDTADISALLGDSPEDEDGKTFGVFYDLNKNEITPRPDDESFIEDNDSIILNGELDGRDIPGPKEDNDKEDDAKMRIKIEDTISEIDASLSIENNPGTTPTGADITYNCIVEGGMSPYTYDLFPCSPNDDSIKISQDTSENSIELTYKYNIGDHGYYSPHLVVTDNLGSYSTHTLTDGILVNNPPNAPAKPRYNGFYPGSGHMYITSQTTDPDPCGNFQYQWEYDGQTSEWGETYLSIYLESMPGSIKVKARDDGDCDGVFDDGAESEWSETLAKSKIIYISLFDYIIEKFPILSKIIPNL